MTNSGTMTNMPQRMPTWLEIHPISGRTTRPGITHNDATEKPVARARAGMASDSATRTPGPMTAPVAEIAQLKRTAIHDRRRQREPDREQTGRRGDAAR